MSQHAAYWLAGLAALGLVVAAVRIAFRRRPSAPPAQRIPAGTVVWAMIPFEDGTGAKDRPCLVLGSQGRDLALVKLTTRDKTHRRDCLALGVSSWDRARRPSWAVCDRIIYLDPAQVRSTGRRGRISDEQHAAVRGLVAAYAQRSIRPR